MDNKAAEKVGQQVLGSKANGNTAHAAERQDTGNAVAHGLHRNKHCSNDDHRPGQFAHRVDGGVVHGLLHFQRRYQYPLSFLDQPKNGPHQNKDETDLKDGLVRLKYLCFRVFMSHFRSPVDSLQPDKRYNRFAGRVQ